MISVYSEVVRDEECIAAMLARDAVEAWWNVNN